MSDPAVAPAAPPVAPPAAPAPPAAAAAPWYQGKLDSEIIGYAQNKAWKLDDPISFAAEAAKAAINAQKFVGAPPEELLRLPKEPGDPAWSNVWQRLGMPKDIQGYDLSDVKFADGTAIDQALGDAIRRTAFENHVPKDAATAFARALVKHVESTDTADAANQKADWDAGVARLKQSWGTNERINELTALEGAKRVGINQEQYEKLARAVGVDVVAEMFRKIGAGTKEDTFHEGNNPNPTTVEAARARKQELLADKDWLNRYTKGEVQARREMRSLNQIITGVVAA